MDISTVEKANKVYMASKRMSKAFYAQDHRAWSAARDEYSALTEGMTKKQIIKLVDKATVCVTLDQI